MTVQEIVDAAIASGDEIGLQVAAYIDGELAIDIAAGVDADTLIHGYSVGKGTAAVLAAFLVERGELGYDTPVAEYWPEFAKHGKEKITVGHVLSHTSGLPFLPPDITVDTLVDQHAMAELLADRTPEWEPGTATGYQGWTYGHLTAEIVRRATGRTIDEVLRDELTKPLGIEDSLLFSVPDDVKVAPLQASTWETFLDGLPPYAGMFKMAPRVVLPVASLANRRDYLRAGIPAGATATARGLAGMYAGVLSGKVVSPETLATATKPRTAELGDDRVFAQPLLKSYGFFLAEQGSSINASIRGFGMTGSGGHVGFADPERNIAFAFLHTRLTDFRNTIVQRILVELGYPDPFA